MARKRRTTATLPPPPAITAKRAERLYRLVRLLGQENQTRASLMRRLKLDLRAFYRELELLRRVGVGVELANNRYSLQDSIDDSMKRLPFPDPQLTLGEAQQLSKGRTAAHQRLKDAIEKLTAG